MSTPAPNYRGNGGSPQTPPYPRAATAADAGDHSVGGLLRQLANDIPDLLVKEMALARAEIGENLRETKAAAGSIATGGAVTLAGLVVLLMSAVYGLAHVVAPWLSALIVGGAVVLIGLGMMSAGKNKLEPKHMSPDRTMHQLHKDQQAIKGRMT